MPWDTFTGDASNEFKGNHLVAFVDGSAMQIELLGSIMDTNGHTQCLIAADGTRYNYNTVISTKKVDHE